MGIVLELPFIISLRFKDSDETFDQISSLTSIITMGFVVFILVSDVFEERFIIVFLKWLPLTMLPVIAGQYYSERGRFPLEALFYTLRKRGLRPTQKGLKPSLKDQRPLQSVDLTYVYLAIIIAAASASNLRSPWFYVVVTILISWGLYSKRSKRFHIIYWFIILLISAIMGYLGQMGLSRLEGHLEELGMRMMLERYSSHDPQSSQTAIGKIGRLKRSGRIVLRVDAKMPNMDAAPLLLLRDAIYNRYLNGQWFVSNIRWNEIKKDIQTASFSIAGAGFVSAHGVTTRDTPLLMVYSLNSEKAMVLSHPFGIFRFDSALIIDAFINNLGTIRIDKDKGFLRYKVYYNDYDDTPIYKVDTFLRDIDQKAVQRFINRYGLKPQGGTYINAMTQPEIINKLISIFQRDYQYSLKYDSIGSMPIEDFLMRKKTGHCEYFATATVLILRSLGIPSRYVTGYAVFERGDKGYYIVRQRHAHAWAEANIYGKWIQVDTTPQTWVVDEKLEASKFETITDFFQGIYFRFQFWKAGGGIERNKMYLYGFIVLTMIYLLIRTKTHSLVRLKYKVNTSSKERMDNTGIKVKPSPFEVLRTRLSAEVFPKEETESLMEWIIRIKDVSNKEYGVDVLKTIIILHYKYRFYCNSDDIYEELDRLVQDWLNDYI